MTLIEQIISDF